MKHAKHSRKIVAALLCVVMLVSLVPASALAEWNNTTYDKTTFGTDGYYNVISQKDYVLVPGAATETEMVLNNSTGTRRQVIHVIEVDPSNPDVSILPGYYNIDKLAANPADSSAYKAAGVTDVANYYDTTLGYQVVGAMNTDLDYTDNAPRVLVYNGQILSGYAGAAAPKSVLYVWNNDGEISCEVCPYVKSELEEGVESGNLLHAISVSFAMVVKDGALVTSKEERTSESAARSMVGVKEDGTLVIVMNDGRGANNSKGFCSYEEGECMLALGCKWAANCDGGGSSSFVTRRAGEEDLVCRCVPCDGAERPTKSSIIIASNVAPTGILDTVNIESDYDIFAPNTTYTFGTTAVDTHGYKMDLPAEAVWALSDNSFGTISGGTFTSNGKLGDVTVQIKLNDAVIGEKTITIANPETLKFTADSTTLPYGKTTTLAFTSLIGEAEVYLDGNSFDFALSNAGGQLDGLVFTAGNDESITKTVVTATYLATNTPLTYTINFGKGSEIIFDFEDGIDGWMGYDDVVDFLYGKGYIKEKSYKALNDYYNGTGTDNFSECVVTETFVSTAENGYVHNGDKALGVVFDMTQCTFNEWCYGVLFSTNGGVLRDVANGKKAITLGMWLRMPENTVQDGGKWANQLTVWKGTDKDHLAGAQIHFQYKGTNLNSVTEEMIPENRWIYVTATLPSDNYVILADPDSNLYRSPSFLRTYIKPNISTKFVWYIDDITLDYSSAVDDRVPPTISNPQYATADTNIAFNDGVVIKDVSAAYTVTVADDNSGIDASTAAIYIDGNKVATTKVVGNQMFCDAVSLGVGTHKVKFEIADKLGNYTTLTRTIVSEVEDHHMIYRTRIELGGHNDSGETPMPGSLYYIDVTSNYSDAGVEAEFTLALNTANTWELDHIIKGAGVEYTYAVNPCKPNEVTFSMTSPTAKGTLLSIPVRVYNPVLTATSEATPSAVSGRTFTAALNVEMTSCTVFGSYGNYDEFCISEFAGNRTVTRHEHTAQAVEDKAAELGVDGYTGRTYCDVCQSVVDWGETIPALTHIHSYELVNAKFVCTECGEVYEPGTGIFEMNGKLYYAIGNNLTTGWQDAGDGLRCYAHTDYTLAVGEETIKGITYVFDENGCTEGAWVSDYIGTKFSYGPDFYHCTAANPLSNVAWETIGGKTYAFDRDGYRHEGIRLLVESNNPGKLYEFTDEGVLIGEYITDASGIFQCNGQVAYLENGTPTAPGLVRVGTDYYYINSGYRAVTGSYLITRTKNMIDVGTYYFAPDGKMINPPPIKYGPQEDGTFYIDGVKQMAYQLVKYEDDYYFISDRNKYLKDITVFLTTAYLADTPFQSGYFTFGSDGKMVIKNGPDEDGYLYVDGVKQMAYQLIKYGDDYYFISDYNKYLKDTTVFLTTAYLADTPFQSGYFTFGSDGKMELKEGANEDGYLYIDGVKQLAYQLIKYGDDYYFISDYNKYLKDVTVFLTASYLEGTPYQSGYFTFGSDGKMELKEGANEDGYLYIDGVKQMAYQLIKYGDDYYFISDRNLYLKDKTVFLTAAYLEDTPFQSGYFTFASDGKMVIKNGPDKDGYLYINGVKQLAYQLVKYEDDYYFISDRNKYVVNKMLQLDEKYVAGTDVEPWYYVFGADGKMVKFIDGIYNARDIGEGIFLATEDGTDINAGLLIRGSELDGATSGVADIDSANYLKNTYGIKTELDLRGPLTGVSEVFGEDVAHKVYPMVFYSAVFTTDGKAVVKDIFTELANPENYPIYMHCAQGIDRTGTIGYILGAVLGVSHSKLCQDYMISIGAYGNKILEVYDGINAYSGATLKDRAAAYLMDCGITQQQIDSLRDIYLAK